MIAPRPNCFSIVRIAASTARLRSVDALASPFASDLSGVADFGLVFGVLLVPAVIFMPMWAAVGHRLGKRRGFIISSFIFMAGLIGSLAAPLVPLAAALALICVTSVGYAGMQMFPLAMLPDTISDDAARTGEQRAGSFTGVWTAGETAAFAIGPALVIVGASHKGYLESYLHQMHDVRIVDAASVLTSSTRWPPSARWTAVAQASVVFPTPPFTL